MKLEECACLCGAHGCMFCVAERHDFANGGYAIIEEPRKSLIKRFEPNAVACGVLPCVEGHGVTRVVRHAIGYALSPTAVGACPVREVGANDFEGVFGPTDGSWVFGQGNGMFK